MTDDTTPAERAAFEAWAREYLLSHEPMASSLRLDPHRLSGWLLWDRTYPGCYEAPWTNSAWSGWQARAQAGL